MKIMDCIQGVRNSSFAVLLCAVLGAITAIRPNSAYAVPFEASQFAVTGPSPHSADVALEIRKLGGNLFDQAIAVELALAVTHPYYASLGGGGFALIRARKPGAIAFETVVLDFREVAPKKAHRDLFKEKGAEAASTGGLAVAVPGVPAGLWAIHKRYGKISWNKLFGPALKLARTGFYVSGEWARLTAAEWPHFNPAGRKIFSREVSSGRASSKAVEANTHLLAPGELLRQPELAKALVLFRDRGPDGFYRGSVAADIARSVEASGGILSLDDLKEYQPLWRTPLVREWRGHRLQLMPLPSSGGLILAQALEIYDQVRKRQPDLKPRSAAELHLIAESLKLSFATRGSLGDPANGEARAQVETKLLESKRLDRLAALVQMDGTSSADATVKTRKEATKPPTEAMGFALSPQKLSIIPEVNPLSASATSAGAHESTETTHFSMADRDGNAIAFTVTLNGSYGSGVVSNRFGIALNDQMDDFAAVPGVPNQYGLTQGEANAVAPGRRPLSSMSPTLIEKDGRLVAVLGAPGGPRIASAVFQGALHIIANGASAEEAVHWPRVHHQYLPDSLFVEHRRTAPELIDRLIRFGHKVSEKDTWVAKLYAITLDQSGKLSASADPRGEGYSGGR